MSVKRLEIGQRWEVPGEAPRTIVGFKGDWTQFRYGDEEEPIYKQVTHGFAKWVKWNNAALAAQKEGE